MKGVLSAVPRSLGLAAVSDVYNQSRLLGILEDAKNNLEYYARIFSNRNEPLQKGIKVQHKFALDLWNQNWAAPVELNVELGYSGPISFSKCPPVKYTSINAVLFVEGQTHIISSNPSAAPALDLAYYSHLLDFETHVGG